MATEQTLDTINNANLKTVGEAPAWSIAQKAMNDISHAKRVDSIAEVALSNLVAHQGRMFQFSELAMGKFGENATSVDPLESVAVGKTLRSESDAALTSTLAALAAGQIGAKTAMTTPPETGVTQLFAQLNALNAQNYSNNTTNSSLASLMAAISSILTKIAYSTPPESGK